MNEKEALDQIKPKEDVSNQPLLYGGVQTEKSYEVSMIIFELHPKLS